jgi:hypothetical protein
MTKTAGSEERFCGQLMLLVHKPLLKLMCIPQVVVTNERAGRKTMGGGDVGHMRG